MPRLVVTALSEDLLAAPGNRKANLIVVSVTDLEGTPVRGLQTPDFDVRPIIVAPGGGRVTHLMRAIETDFPGVYLIEVVPDKKSKWKRGVYIFAVAVHKGLKRGQTLASVLMD